MNNFFKLWKKSCEGGEVITEEEKINAARELAVIINHNRLSESSSSHGFLAKELKYICTFNSLIKKVNDKVSFYEALEKKFFESTGQRWSSDKYILVFIPTQLIGGATYVVFELPNE